MLTFTTPQLSEAKAHLVALALSTLYVSSVYVSSKTRLSFSNNSNTITSNRDDPQVIKARLVAVSFATLLCCGLVFYIISGLAPDVQFTDLLHRLGFISWTSFKTHLITPVLFFGPLYVTFLAKVLPGQKYWSWEMHVQKSLLSWQGIRNVLVAPPTEEIVFRGCVLAILHLAGVSKTHLIFLSPLSFGLAHVHHAWDVFNRYGRTSQAAIRALTVTLFQLAYTTLFGCYISYLFLRTSSIYPPISAHMFCNFMGFPRMEYELQIFPNRKLSIIIAYILGVLGFIYFLPAWTFTQDSFYWNNYLSNTTSLGY